MKKVFILLLIIFFNSTLWAQIVDNFTFSINQVQLTTEKGYTRVAIPLCDISSEVGHPELPCMVLRYLLPFDQEISSITILDSTLQLVSNNALVYPKQPEYPINDTTLHPFVQPNESIYNSNTYYPLQAVQSIEQYYEKGYHLALIKVYPIRYTPSMNRLELFSYIHFQLNLSPVTGTPFRPQTQTQKIHQLTESYIRSQIRNKLDLDQNNGGPITLLNRNTFATQPIRLLNMVEDVNPEYIIITNNNDVNGNSLYDSEEEKNMTDVFQEFADWKTQKGIPTKVVTVDNIAANYTGCDVQEKIHNFLAEVHQYYGSPFILLGGDVNVVPQKMIRGRLNHGLQYYPVDLYYVAVGNTWDDNGNGIYGEYVDHADYNAEFYFGRASVENVQEALIFLRKNMAYETLEDLVSTERNYVNNVVGMQAYLHNPPLAEDTTRMGKMEKLFDYIDTISFLHSGITQNNIKKWRCYDSYHFHGSQNYENYWFHLSRDSALACFGGIIPTTINERSHIILHSDHSSYLSLGASALHNHMTINRQDIDDLICSPYHKIVFTVGCSPGEYDKDCIAERLLNKSDAGTVAICASSQVSAMGEEDMFATFINSLYYYEDNEIVSNPCFFNLGLIHARTVSLYNSIHGHLNNNNNINDCYIRKNHLFGDPELPVWTREPVDLTVNTSPSIITNQNGQFTVSVSGMAYSEYATNDVTVCVMKDDEVYLRDYYNGTAHSHNFVFDVIPETAGELKVTVTGHNYIPYETTVPVSISGKNLFVSQKTVQDATGNNDGKLDAGETVNLSISLKNNGTVNLANVNATLSCEFTDAAMNQNLSSYLTLTTANASYGTITKNTTVTRNNYQLTLSNTVPDRSALRCTLTVSDGAGATWTKTFTLPIGAAEMDYVSVRHQVKPNGRIGLDIELTNTGFGTAKGITATLTSQDVQVSTATADYGAFSHLQSKTQSFEFIPNGNFNGDSFNLNITDAYNKSWSFAFDLNIVTDTVANLVFESTERSIKLKWDPKSGSTGYNVYRSMTWNGDYVKQNSHPFHSSAYTDLGLDAMQAYCYGVTFLDASGNESPMARVKAWTTPPLAAGWPVSIPDGLGFPWSTAPNVADVDGDGKQEVFLTAGSGDGAQEKGSVLGFNYLGEELYDIDHNPTTVSGFANPGISMTCSPAIGDIDNDGVMEVVVATRDNLNNHHKLLVYKNRDADQDGIPDLAWEHALDYKNFNGVVLTDLDDNGTLEIIAPNQGRKIENGSVHDTTYLEVFNASGTYYYPKNTIWVRDPRNKDKKAVTMPIVADLDNDGHKEIVFGLEGGVYSWSCHNEQLSTLVPYSQTSNERTDCPVTAADIDGDGVKEVLYMAIRNRKGYIRAVNPDGTSVSGWNGDAHFVSLTSDDMNYAWPPYFSVADIDNDGEIEVFAADKDTLKMWNGDGTPFGTGYIRIPNLDGRYFQPVIADIDGFGDCEVIVPSQNGYIHAYKTNGNTVPGWPLAVTELATIPVVTDLDGDGLNEVVAASKTGLYVWHTEGVSDRNQCDRFRYNRHNNAVYEIPCSHIGTPLEISGTQVWNDDRRFNRDVIVNSGGHLTVKSELRLSGDSKIIVKPGGRLILDGCTITNSCPGGIWPGIEVWGDSDAHQQEVNGGYLQGYVELKNGATIENARCALRLRNPLVSGTSGGIVHAADAHFVNNALAVEACSYTNHGTLSQREIDYHGWFHDCTFTVDEDFPAQAAFHCHASLTEVNGLNFEGCAFSVNRSVDSVDFQCSAIHAYNAAFKATRHCDSQTLPCPSASVTRSSFSGFYRAVESLCDGQNTRTVMVRDADFSGNDVGVYALNTSLAAVLGNTFAVGGRMDCSFGIWLEGVAVCQVEENSFASASGTNSTTYGAAFKNSEAANDVYRNQFSGLDYANLAIGRNAIVTGIGGHPSVTTGLTYTCNTNASNTIDFRIDDHGSYSGVQPAQGSAAVGAGNTFSGSDWHIYNAGDYPITYYYHAASPGQTPATAKLQQTTPATAVSANRCRTHYGDGPVRLSPTAIDSLTTVWNDARQSYQSLARLYESLSQADNADNAMMASVADAMSEQAHEATMAAGDILRSLADSPGSESSAMRSWLAALECPAADRLAIASLLESGDPDGALDLALSMPAKYGNKQLDPVEQEEYTSLVKLYADLRRSGRTALELTEGEKTLAEGIAAEGTGQAQSLARALVEGIGGDRTLMACPAEIASHVVRGDGEAKGAMTPESESLSGFAVSVIPTPAHTWITVEYTLPECCDNADFELASITGVKVMTATLDGNKGSKTLDLKGLTGGVYLYTVHCGNHNYNGKVVVTK